MSYVDLNPSRAAMATTLETSDHTSIKLCIEYGKNKANQKTEGQNEQFQPKPLMPFAGNLRQPMPRGLIFNLIDYIEMVDWTGRIIRDGKRGAINAATPPFIQRLDISTDYWIEPCTKFESQFEGIAGSAQSIKTLCALCAHFGLARQIYRSNSETLYG